MPALRVLVPFVLGIVLGTYIPGTWPALLSGLLGVLLYLFLLLGMRGALSRYGHRWMWFLPVSLLSISAGMLALQLWRPLPLDLTTSRHQQATGLVENIDTYDFSMRLQIRLESLDGTSVAPRCVLLSTRGCDYSLHEGDVVSWTCDLNRITNLGNPDEFDRESHQWHHGILYSQHLPISHLYRIGHRHSLLSQAARLRRHLTMAVVNTSLSPPVQDLMLALLLGNNQQLDHNVRNRFSQAGIAHILALSGLHVALLTYLIWFLLFPLDYLRLKKLRLLITLFLLIGFAVLTGLSPSVVRATIMIGFTLVAVVLYRRSTALNAMCLSALLTLCIWPTAIYQAGFQLSYVTVAAIVGFSGKALPATAPKRRFAHWLWSMTSTSAIAMCATVILSAYYFCSISLLSVVSNILILPVMPIIMVLGIVFLLLAALGIEWGVLETMIEQLYSYMTHVSDYVASIPGSHIGGVYVTGLTVLLFYLALACLVGWLMSRRGRWLMATLGAILLIVVQLGWISWSTPSNCMMVLNDYYSTPILWHENGTTYIWLPDDPTADRLLFEQNHRRLLAHLGSDSLCWVTNRVNGQRSMVHSPWAYLHGKRMLVAGRGINKSWLDAAGDMGRIDLLVITKRYSGQLSDIIAHCDCGLVLISGDLSSDRHSATIAACQQLGVLYHDIGKGYYGLYE